MEVKPKQSMAHNQLLLLYLLKRNGNLELSELEMVRTYERLSFMGYFDLKECMFELEQNGHLFFKPTSQTIVYKYSGKRIANMLEVCRTTFACHFAIRLTNIYKKQNHT